MDCPCCGQPMPEVRLGVKLTPLKARIFDIVKRAGNDGILADELFKMVYEERKRSRHSLKAHVWQINDVIADEGWRIVGIIRGVGSYFALRRL
jgi:hypothetical protein